MAPSVNAPSLLLLTCPPRPATHVNLNAAYRQPLTAALTKLRDESTSESRTAVLVVAVTCPILNGPAPRAKSMSWNKAQSYLAGVYSIISAICAENGIATDLNGGPGSVDSRVVLVDHERKRSYSPDVSTNKYEANCTTILDLAAFASTVHPWRRIFHPSCESGYELVAEYLKFAEGKQKLMQNQLVAVQGGISMSTPGKSAEDVSDSSKLFKTTVLGGTFDHLHPGHKLLLHATALLLKVPDKDSNERCELVVGVTGNELLVNKKYSEELQSGDSRARGVLEFLATVFNSPTTTPLSTTTPNAEEIHGTFRDGRIYVRCLVIQDPFGPTITEEHLGAIVVSGETRSGGKAINDKRTEKGWHTLEIYEIDVLDARGAEDESEKGEVATPTENFASKISSTAIRKQRAEARRSQL